MPEYIDVEYCVAGAGIAGLLLASRLADSGKSMLVFDQGPELSEEQRATLLRGVTQDFGYTADYNDHVRAPTVTPTASAEDDGETATYGFQQLFGVGGTALHFQGLMVRPIEADLEVKSRFGYGRDWPIDYNQLESWLLDAEHEVGVAGNEDNPYAALRSGPYAMPGHAFSWFDREMLAPGLKQLGMTAHSCPHAVNSQPYRGRSACQACRFCKFCPTGARYSPDRVHGQLLKTKPNVTLQTGLSLHRLETSNDGGRIVAAHARRLDAEEEVVIRAENYVVALGGVATPRLLLLSASNGDHASGLGNMGGQLGVGFGDHWNNFVTYDLGRPVGSRLGFETLLCEHGRRNVDRGEQPSWLLAGSPANDGLPIGSLASDWSTHNGNLSLDAVRESIPQMATVWAMCETSHSGSVELDPDVVDGFGDPVAKITLPLTDWDRRSGQDFEIVATQLGEAMSVAHMSDPLTLNPSNGHPAGATAMATGPDEGVCDADLKVFGLDNLYVVSSSVFPHMGACPPTLTIVALALRLANHLEPNRRRQR